MRPASVADIPAMVRILAQAFEVDPHVAWFIGDPKDPAKALRRRQALERFLCHHAVSCRLAYLSDDGRAAALWQKSGCKPHGVGYRLANLGYFWRCGLSATIRSLAGEGQANKRLPKGPYLFLWTIGVAAEARGRGLFRELVSPVLQEADSGLVPVFLETTVTRNVSIYEHYGFTVVERYRYRDGPEVAFMRREPGAAPTGSEERQAGTGRD
jgi:ribosomal protein S18 acetylase RimI-like enzyme